LKNLSNSKGVFVLLIAKITSLHLLLQKKLRVRYPKKATKKITTTIRLAPDVLETFKATGDGWQTWIDT
jgi:uncharacterized protein (DUF4415 family)